MMRWVVWGCMGSALAAGCMADGAPSPHTGEISDSAGVRVVHHTSEEDLAVVRPATVLTVGPETAGAPAEFGAIVDVAVRSDTLFVLDGMAQSVSVFGPDGHFLRTIGSPGDGPGELSRFAASLLSVEDELWIADWGHGRIHRYGPEDEVLPSIAIPAGGTRSWWRVGGDGQMYARTLRRLVNDNGAWAGDDRLVRATDDGALDTIFRFEYGETDIGAPGRPALPLVVNAPMWAVLTDGSIVTTDLESNRLSMLDERGTLRQLITAESWVRHPPSPEDADALVSLLGDKLVALGGSRSTLEQLEVTGPHALPALTALMPTPEGGVMVQRMGAARSAHPRVLNAPDPPAGWGGPRWDMLSPNGARLAIIELEPRTRLLRITEARMVGVQHDPLGREQVVVWERPVPVERP
ncbi:MAG: 6-bladed beta-propeller [Gemmatimonadota bacterium]